MRCVLNYTKYNNKKNYKLVIAITLLVVTSVGCHRVESNSTNDVCTTLEVPQSFLSYSQNTVKLSEVKKPVYGEVFCSDDELGEITWGIGENYVDDRSAFPGFDYPILIYSTKKPANEITLTTEYGTYEYLAEWRKTAFDDDGLIRDSNTGIQLIYFNQKQEMLYVLCENVLYKFHLVNGTRIVEG